MNLADYIRAIPDFPQKGIMFRDITPLLADTQAFRESILQMKDVWLNAQVDAIAGLDARGFIFGAALAYEMGVPFVPIRKKGKLPFETVSVSYDLEYGSNVVEMHTDAVNKGDRVLIVDDLLATGGTAAAACQLIEQVGGVVAGCQFMIELDNLNGREKLSCKQINSILHY